MALVGEYGYRGIGRWTWVGGVCEGTWIGGSG